MGKNRALEAELDELSRHPALLDASHPAHLEVVQRRYELMQKLHGGGDTQPQPSEGRPSRPPGRVGVTGLSDERERLQLLRERHERQLNALRALQYRELCQPPG
jgi:hypothetical protein